MEICKHFKALAEETRLRLFALLLSHELNVNELVQVLQMGQSRISRHLRVLSESGLLRHRRNGGFSYYQARSDPELEHLIQFVKRAAEAEGACREDASRAQAIVRERKSRTRHFFNQVAEHWERLKSEILGDLDLARIVSQAAPPSTRALDMGCGTGDLLVQLLNKAETVIGVDHSFRMLSMARLKMEALEAGSRCDLRLGELEHLPLRDREVDLASISMVLHHLPLPEAGIREANRVLSPEGTLLLADFAKHSREDIRRKYGATWLGFEPEEIETWLHASGFDLQHSESHPVQNGLVVRVYRAVKTGDPPPPLTAAEQGLAAGGA